MLRLEPCLEDSFALEVYLGEKYWKTVPKALFIKALKTFRFNDLTSLNNAWNEWQLRAARQEALRLLGIKNRSSQDLSEKLRLKGYEQAAVLHAVQEMQQQGYIDDLDSARMLIRKMCSKGYGAHRMVATLKQKGIWHSSLHQEIMNVEPQALEKALHRLRGKKDLMALFRSLQRLGFDHGKIRSSLQYLSDQDI